MLLIIPNELRIEVLFYIILQLVEIGVIVMLIKWILGMLGFSVRNMLISAAAVFGLVGLKKWLENRHNGKDFEKKSTKS